MDPSFITTSGFSSGVGVDASHVYWANSDPNSDTGTIGRADRDGTAVDQSFITVTGAFVLSDVAVDGEHVYWSDAGGAIGRANLDGTGVDKRFTRVGFAQAMAVDAKHIYWAGDGTIGRADIDGTGVDNRFITPLGAPGPYGVAVDALRTFSVGKAKKNEKKGTAKLTVKVPGPGELELAETESVKGTRKRAEEKRKQKLPVRPKGEAKELLNRKGKAKVKAEVTYTPTGGNPSIVGNTDTETVKLIKR